MIQRIQSLFLLLAAGFFGGQFFTSFASTTGATGGFFADSVFNVQDHPVLIGLCALGILSSILALFMYRNRPNQIKASYVTVTLSVLLPLIAVLLYTNQTEQMDNVEIHDQLGLYLPIGSALMGFLAAHYIKKDSKLVKSMDRLR